MRPYELLNDSGQKHIGPSIRREGKPASYIVHHITHVIPDYTDQGEPLYITTAYDVTVTDYTRFFTTIVNTSVDPLGHAAKIGSAEHIEAPKTVDGSNEDALRAYHLGLVEEYASEPPQRTFVH